MSSLILPKKEPLKPLEAVSTHWLEHPILGILILKSRQDRLIQLHFSNRPPSETTPNDAFLKDIVSRLHAYFSGQPVPFSDIPLSTDGTAFQKQVWGALQQIDYGETRDYQWLAQTIGNPKACRAVGNANGKNPIALIIPCHRVIAHDGSLGGYSCGLDKKRYLLNLEKH